MNKTNVQSGWNCVMSTRPLLVLFFVLAELILVGGASVAKAEIAITTPDGFGADSFVRRHMWANCNCGGCSTIWVKHEGTHTVRKGYVRFDLTALTAPVVDALLQFTVSTNYQIDPAGIRVFNIYGLNDGTVAGGGTLGEDWLEGTGCQTNTPEIDLTWNNAPANNSSIDGVNTGTNPGEATLIGQFGYGAAEGPGTVLTFDNAASITANALINFINSDTNGMVTFILTQVNLPFGSDSGFYAKEGDLSGNYNDGINDPPKLIIPNNPPVADAGPDQIVEQESYAGTEVTLDASGSTDPDSTPGTNDDIVYFDWWEGDIPLSSGEIIDYVFPLGHHTVTLYVKDSAGATDTDTVDIAVADTIEPAISSLVANPDVLWPPNHEMVEVMLTVDANDICDPAPTCEIVYVTSNEPINGLGDGNTEPDWQLTEDPLTVLLRAERSGTGAGRVYTIDVRCTDASGNAATASVDVVVPHDQANGEK